MLLKFSKYHGAGNDFLLADNRDGSISLSEAVIQGLCDRHTGFGADGVMLLEDGGDKDFKMVYYNSDGSGGMMCGNGGRCIVAFAADSGVVPSDGLIRFDAADGEHSAYLFPSEKRGEHKVRLKMKDVAGIVAYPSENAWFLDTGTRHLVKFVEGLDSYPLSEAGPVLRHDSRFAPVGTNVNFVEPMRLQEGTVLNIRTFEKGVEDETLACGTGIVASAMAAWSAGMAPSAVQGPMVGYSVKAAIADLEVEFVPSGAMEDFRACDVWLAGPAQRIGTVEVELD